MDLRQEDLRWFDHWLKGIDTGMMAEPPVKLFPRFDRNLNTGEDIFTSTRMQTAHQTVLHDARYPSHVVLPVIPR